jgi:hypothetical protein
MRLKFLALLLSAVALLPATTKAQEGTTDVRDYALSYAFEEGKSATYKVRAGWSQDGLMPMKINGELTLLQLGKKPDAEAATHSVKQTVERVVASMDMFGQKQEYDTAAGPEKNGQGGALESSVRGLLGNTELTLKATGEVTEAKSSRKGQSPFESLLGIGHLPFDLLRLPEKPVKVGESWTHKVERTNQSATGKASKVIMNFTFTLRSVNDQDGQSIANIAISVKPEMDAMPGNIPAKFKSAKGSGKVSFNLTKKQLRRLEYRLRMLGETDMGDGQAQKLEIIQSLKIRLEEPKKKADAPGE